MTVESIRQGATFYREVALFSDAAKTQPLDLTNKTPRASLMKIDGTPVADFSCAVLGERAEGRIAWTMPRATTAGLTAGDYIADIDLDDADEVTTDPGPRYRVIVLPGQKKEEA